MSSDEARALADRFGGTPPDEPPPPPPVAFAPARRATIAIVVACSAMFVVQMVLAGRNQQSLLDLGALQGRWVLAGHPEALVSYAFLHGGVIHILMNMSALFSVGTALETLVGARRTIVVFTLSVLGGGILVMLLKPEQLVVGASAGIFGVMTALYGISLRASDLPAAARSRLRKSLGATLAINLLISFLPNVSLLGHAGGALAGLVLGVSGVITTSRLNRVFDIAAIACVATLVGSVACALVRGQM